MIFDPQILDKNHDQVSTFFVNIMHTHILDDTLDVTLNRLVVLLREKVGPKWREFGEEVDIDEVVLDSIAKTCFPENCLVEVLDYWLKYTDEKITWRDVAYVLKSINFHELALDVVQIYKTGIYSCECRIAGILLYCGWSSSGMSIREN